MKKKKGVISNKKVRLFVIEQWPLEQRYTQNTTTGIVHTKAYMYNTYKLLVFKNKNTKNVLPSNNDCYKIFVAIHHDPIKMPMLNFSKLVKCTSTLNEYSG